MCGISTPDFNEEDIEIDGNIIPDKVIDTFQRTKGFFGNFVNKVLEEDKCPKCGNKLYEGICEFTDDCIPLDSDGESYIQHISDTFFDNKEGEINYYSKQEKKEKGNGNGEKIEVQVIGLGRHINYYNYKSRIKKNEGIIEFEDNGKKFKVNVGYKFSEINNYQEKSSKNKIIKDKNIEFKYQKGLRGKLKVLTKNKNKWEACFYNYNDLYKIVKSILLDRNLNKFV